MLSECGEVKDPDLQSTNMFPLFLPQYLPWNTRDNTPLHAMFQADFLDDAKSAGAE